MVADKRSTLTPDQTQQPFRAWHRETLLVSLARLVYTLSDPLSRSLYAFQERADKARLLGENARPLLNIMDELRQYLIRRLEKIAR